MADALEETKDDALVRNAPPEMVMLHQRGDRRRAARAAHRPAGVGERCTEVGTAHGLPLRAMQNLDAMFDASVKKKKKKKKKDKEKRERADLEGAWRGANGASHRAAGAR